MDNLTNPFSPGAGSPPPELAGRQPILDRAHLALGRLKLGKHEKSFLLVGLRGVGKTVLLREIEKLAKTSKYQTVFIEAPENKSLATLLIPPLRDTLYALDRMEHISQKVKRGIKVLNSFINSVKLKYHDLEFSIGVDPETGTADSGDLEADLPALLEVIGEAAADRHTVVSIIMDEMQYLTEKDLSALITAFHRLSQKQLPMVLIGAGLPQLVALAGNSKSYTERLFDFPRIGPLKDEDAIKALQDPVQEQGAQFTPEALQEIIHQTKGYPYFIQEWGYQAWNISSTPTIDINVINEANDVSIRHLDESFFRVRLERLTPGEKKYLRAMAELGIGPHRSGDIAEKLGVKPQSISPTRSSLIKKGMIFSPAHGDTDFTVPLFDAFMKRAMPQMPT